MTIPFTVHYNDARAVRYTREENGLDGVSRRMVQRSDGLPFGVHHATVKAPGSYGGTSGEDVAIYALEGSPPRGLTITSSTSRPDRCS